jgi:hypothetical protein
LQDRWFLSGSFPTARYMRIVTNHKFNYELLVK